MHGTFLLFFEVVLSKGLPYCALVCRACASLVSMHIDRVYIFHDTSCHSLVQMFFGKSMHVSDSYSACRFIIVHHINAMLFVRTNLASRTFVFILLVLIATSIYAAWIFSQVVFAKAPNPLVQRMALYPPSLDFANAPNQIARHVPLNPPAVNTPIAVSTGSLEATVLPPNISNTPKTLDAGPTSNPLPLDVNIVLHNASLCESRRDLRWVFYVHSAPGNRVKRDLIRATWGDQRVHVPHTTQLLFMLGQPTDRKLQV